MPVPDGRRCDPGSIPVRAAFDSLSVMTLIGAGSENSVTGTSFRAGPMKDFHVFAGRQPPVIGAHPRTFFMGMGSSRYPTQMAVDSVGVYPANHEFLDACDVP